MEKKKEYPNVRFSPDAMRDARAALELLRDADAPKNAVSRLMAVSFRGESWDHDTEEEFFSDIRKLPYSAHYSVRFDSSTYTLQIACFNSNSSVAVTAPTRAKIEAVFGAVERHVESCRVPVVEIEKNKVRPRVFVGHGRSQLWRDLKDHLQDLHGYEVEAYETGARAGHTIRDVLEHMTGRSNFACLVLSAEDSHADGSVHARENVIHELGLFQGVLGYPRAIALVEDPTVEFSNLHGIQQLRFQPGRIKETFGDVLATLRREFGDV